MQFDLKDSIVIIIGGSGYLGRFFVDLVINNSGTPYIIDSNNDSNEELLLEYQSRGVDLNIYNIDVTNKLGWDQLQSDLSNSPKKILGLIYAAALNPKIEGSNEWANDLLNIDSEYWSTSHEVGIVGVLITLNILLPILRRNSPCSIVLIGSDLGYISPDNRLYCNCAEPTLSIEKHHCPIKPINYSVHKSALVGLMRNLSTILGPDKIHVNLLSPGCIRDDSMRQEFIDKISKLIPLGRPGSKKELEIPLMVLLHAHDCYLTGQSLIIDGGRTII